MMNLLSEQNTSTAVPLFIPSHITAVLEDHACVKKDLLFLMDEICAQKENSSTGFVLKESNFFPYLSLSDNLFLASPIKEKDKKMTLQQLAVLFELNTNLLIKSFTQLPPYDQIKLQLMQNILSDKQTIIIDDIFSEISIFQKQKFLPLLKKIAVEKKRAILLFTSDKQIAESSYVGQILPSIYGR